MHCNGKCQMMKKIKQEEKKNAQAPEQNKQSKNEIPLSSRSYFPTITSSNIREANHFYTPSQSDREIKMPRSIFHPPAIA